MGGRTTLHVVGLLDTDVQRSTVIRALAQLEGGMVLNDVVDFLQSVRRDAPDAVAIGVLGPRGGTNAPLVGRLQRDHPSVGIVVVCDTTSTAVQQLLHLARAGADEVMLISTASPAELAAVVERACARRREGSVWHRIAPAVPAECHDIFEFCFTSSLRRRSVGSLAQHLGIDRSTIASRLRRAGLPPAHAILSWSRLIAVTGLMESSRMSIEQAALRAGFESATGLRAFTRRLLGAAPRAVAARGRSHVEQLFFALIDGRDVHERIESSAPLASRASRRNQQFR